MSDESNTNTAEGPSGTGKSQTTASPPQGYGSWGQSGLPPSLGPSDEEVDAWAEQEHLRRQAWLAGPSAEEKHEWRRQERIRRLASLGFGPEPGFGGGSTSEASRDRRALSKRYARDAQLATEGLGLLLATLPFRMIAELVNAGQEWEEDYPSGQRRRIPLYDDEPR